MVYLLFYSNLIRSLLKNIQNTSKLDIYSELCLDVSKCLMLMLNKEILQQAGAEMRQNCEFEQICSGPRIKKGLKCSANLSFHSGYHQS